MKHNYRSMRMKFDKAQQAQAEQYRKLGMSEKAIHDMYLFDLAVFNSDRKHIRHLAEPVEMTAYDRRTGESHRMDISEFPAKESVELLGSDDWMQEIENAKLFLVLKRMPDDYIAIITLLMKGALQKDIAVHMGCSIKSINNKIARIRKILRKFI